MLTFHPKRLILAWNMDVECLSSKISLSLYHYCPIVQHLLSSSCRIYSNSKDIQLHNTASLKVQLLGVRLTPRPAASVLIAIHQLGCIMQQDIYYISSAQVISSMKTCTCLDLLHITYDALMQVSGSISGLAIAPKGPLGYVNEQLLLNLVLL